MIVLNGTHADKIDVNDSDNVRAGNTCMFLGKLFISYSRYDELILARLAAIYMIVCIEKGSVLDHKWHLVALMHYLKVSILVQLSDVYFFIIAW